jgi:hypothetical protein
MGDGTQADPIVDHIGLIAWLGLFKSARTAKTIVESSRFMNASER